MWLNHSRYASPATGMPLAHDKSPPKVEDDGGRERHGRGVLDVGVRLPAGEVRGVHAIIHLHDGEGCGLSVDGKLSMNIVRSSWLGS
jgi:hypothetical protein